jgi:UDP-N-acetylglucosamine 3-dehydrogenase
MPKSDLKFGLVGAGIMGGHHARIAAANPDVELVAVVDPDRTKGEALAGHVQADYHADVADLFGKVDAAIVTAPSEYHAEIGLELLAHGIDVLVEKPIATTVEDAKKLVAAAEYHDRVLMVGHVERFNPAVLDLPRFRDKLIHVDIRRIGPFTSRVLADVVLDLMIHDVDLVRCLVGGEVVDVTAVTRAIRTSTADLATALLTFDNGVSASLTASRLGHTKQRQIEMTQHENVVFADLLRQQITVHRVEHAEFVDDGGARYRQNAVVEYPYLEHNGEPLTLEQRHFARCVKDHSTPLVSGEDGLVALQLAMRIRDEAVRSG